MKKVQHVYKYTKLYTVYVCKKNGKPEEIIDLAKSHKQNPPYIFTYEITFYHY